MIITRLTTLIETKEWFVVFSLVNRRLWKCPMTDVTLRLVIWNCRQDVGLQQYKTNGQKKECMMLRVPRRRLVFRDWALCYLHVSWLCASLQCRLLDIRSPDVGLSWDGSVGIVSLHSCSSENKQLLTIACALCVFRDTSENQRHRQYNSRPATFRLHIGLGVHSAATFSIPVTNTPHSNYMPMQFIKSPHFNLLCHAFREGLP